MDNIESYNKSYSELKYAIRENFSFNWSNIQDDSVLRNILRDRKWAEDDISRFINVDKHWVTAVHNFVSTSPYTAC